MSTNMAERKIIEIARWSVKKWGKKTTREYLANLDKIINLVASGELPCQKKSRIQHSIFLLPCQTALYFL